MKIFKKQIFWFTLVELLVVIVIIGILGTAGLISFSAYSLSARDANRLSSMEKMRDSLMYISSRKQLPLPTSSINVNVNGNLVAYQWYTGQAVLDEMSDFKGTGKDPKDLVYFTYYVTRDRAAFQLLWLFEENTNIDVWFFPQANAVNYSARYPKVEGKPLWVLTDASYTPVQELWLWASIDIGTTGTSYIAHLSDSVKTVWAASALKTAAWNYTCKRILQVGMAWGSGYYNINPNAAAVEVNAYCDMTNDGGGWTRIGRLVNNGAITENLVWINIPFTTLKAVKATDTSDNAIVTFAASQVANTTSWINTVEGSKIMLWAAGGFGIYNTWQSTCSWASDLWMRWSGYNGSCWTYPTALTAVGKGTTAVSNLDTLFDVDIYVKN